MDAPFIDPRKQPSSTASVNAAALCKLCTVRLERLCDGRALWFRLFRTALAAAVRVWSLWHPVNSSLYRSRSAVCHGCLRFRKNVLKEESRIFNWLDGFINPLFNYARDSLLLPHEREAARIYAAEAATARLSMQIESGGNRSTGEVIVGFECLK